MLKAWDMCHRIRINEIPGYQLYPHIDIYRPLPCDRIHEHSTNHISIYAQLAQGHKKKKNKVLARR